MSGVELRSQSLDILTCCTKFKIPHVRYTTSKYNLQSRTCYFVVYTLVFWILSFKCEIRVDLTWYSLFLAPCPVVYSNSLKGNLEDLPFIYLIVIRRMSTLLVEKTYIEVLMFYEITPTCPK